MSRIADLRAAAAPLLGRLLARGIARDSAVLFGGYGAQLLLQIGWLVMVLRVLGPEGYGTLVALTAVTIAVSSFAGLGCDQLLIRAVSADRSRLAGWVGHSVVAIGASGLALSVLLLPVLAWLEPGGLDAWHLLLLAATDMVLGRWANLGIAIYMATGQSVRQSTMAVTAQVTRLLAIVAAAAMPGALTLDDWVVWYAAGTALSVLVCLGLVRLDHGPAEWRWIGGQHRDGLAFGAETALQAAARDLDKPLVLAMLGPAAAGAYAAAQRIVDAMSLPIRSVGYAVYPRLFAMQAEAPGSAGRFALRLLPALAGLGALAGLVPLFGAGLLGMAFPRYAELPLLLQLLAPMPALMAVYVLGADLLSVEGRQVMRLGVVVVSLAATLAAVFLGAIAAGLVGATLARLAMVGAVGALPWGVRRWAARRPAEAPA